MKKIGKKVRRFSVALVLAIVIILSIKGCNDGNDEFPCGDCTWNNGVAKWTL